MREPHLYPFFDLLVDSAIPLPELGRTVAESAQRKTDRERISFAITDAELITGGEPNWRRFPEDPDQGEIFLEYARIGESHLLRFPELADFLVDAKRLSILCRPGPDTSLSSVRHLLLDQVLPRFVGRLGRLVLHASAVLHEGEAIAFVGRSGWGKSTLAASFVHSGKPGFGDDSLLLEMDQGARVQAIVSYRGARLWPDAVEALFEPEIATLDVAHYTDKKRLLFADSAQVGATRAQLRALFVLNDPGEAPSADIRIRSLRGTGALMALVESSFSLDPRDLVFAGSQLKLASDILRSTTRVSLLEYPRVHGDLARVRGAILESLDRQDPFRSSSERL